LHSHTRRFIDTKSASVADWQARDHSVEVLLLLLLFRYHSIVVVAVVACKVPDIRPYYLTKGRPPVPVIQGTLSLIRVVPDDTLCWDMLARQRCFGC
jgi:hypothetical protein